MTDLYTIRLSFDVFQLTRSLTYEFFNPDQSVKSIESVGALTGSFNLEKDEKVQIVVVATSDVSGRSIKMTDINCTFVFVNKIVGDGKSPNLSPFAAKQATFSLAEKEWKKYDHLLPLPTGVGSFSARAAEIKPTVSSIYGLWEMSGFLSVTYWVDDSKNEYTRLFSFDPETSAGSGGPPPGLGYYEKSA